MNSFRPLPLVPSTSFSETAPSTLTAATFPPWSSDDSPLGIDDNDDGNNICINKTSRRDDLLEISDIVVPGVRDLVNFDAFLTDVGQWSLKFDKSVKEYWTAERSSNCQSRPRKSYIKVKT